jgi:ferredoxin-thioredoxin reductase catalytic subunit
MNAQQLFDMMRKVQEPKGYYFNNDRDRVFELLEALIANKQRYGYMGCPCRLLATIGRTVTSSAPVYTVRYRRVRSRYCNLYVSRSGTRANPPQYAPEKRPPEGHADRGQEVFANKEFRKQCQNENGLRLQL